MENEQGTTTESTSTETIDSQISELRQSEPYQAPYGHPGQPEAKRKMHALYEARHKLESDNGNETVPAQQNGNGNHDLGFNPNREAPNAKQTLEDATAAGLDTSDLSESDMDDARIEGLQILTQIETGDLASVSRNLSRAANAAGLPPESIKYLRQFTRQFAQADDPLTNEILKTITNHIFNTRRDL